MDADVKILSVTPLYEKAASCGYAEAHRVAVARKCEYTAPIGGDMHFTYYPTCWFQFIAIKDELTALGYQTLKETEYAP
jgi:hypothetical protein